MSDAVSTRSNFEWHQGTPDTAFALAAARGVPLFLYWGAAWCPPCNRIKASVFERADFQALGSGFVALHIDGDSSAPQQMAERFHVRSYPTLIVFRADGAEITRLPCELEGARFVELLGVALAASRTVTESLGAALSRERPLADDEWRLLSFYSWDTDEHQVLKSLDLAATLASLARACTLPEARAAAGMACLARGGHVRQGRDRPARGRPAAGRNLVRCGRRARSWTSSPITRSTWCAS
ncbi:thioredoxin family protein [Massilia sp. H-1]|nr:thioredoxin family protein [Massilia sp. H-1]